MLKQTNGKANSMEINKSEYSSENQDPTHYGGTRECWGQ